MREHFGIHSNDPGAHSSLWWVEDTASIPHHAVDHLRIAKGWMLTIRHPTYHPGDQGQEQEFSFFANVQFTLDEHGSSPGVGNRIEVAGAIAPDGSLIPTRLQASGATLRNPGVGLLELSDHAMLEAMVARAAELGGIPMVEPIGGRGV